jgi:hypothetical protein
LGWLKDEDYDLQEMKAKKWSEEMNDKEEVTFVMKVD